MQGSFLNTVTFSEFTDLVRRKFVQNQNFADVESVKGLFIKDPVGKGQGNTKLYQEIDTETFGRTKREGERAKKAKVGTGYSVTLTKKRIAMEIDITQEMRDENRYAEVGSLITDLSSFCPNRLALDLSHIFTFCNATSYTDMDGESVNVAVGDGLSLINSTHTLKYSSTTYSNQVSGNPVFSKGALEAAESLATTNVLSNFGEKRVIKFNTIITGEDPNTVHAVRQFLNSTSDNTQDNSGVVNTRKNMYRHVELPYLASTATGAYDSTKRRWWFLGAVGIGYSGWQAIYAEYEAAHMKPVTDNGANHDYSADVWTYGVRHGRGIRAISGRGLIGSLPTS
jgi:hypothetical protein